MFIYYSGHGTSIDGDLHLTLPTAITEKTYKQNCATLAEVIFDKRPRLLEDDEFKLFKEWVITKQKGIRLAQGEIKSGYHDEEIGNYQFGQLELSDNEDIKKIKDQKLDEKLPKILQKIQILAD